MKDLAQQIRNELRIAHREQDRAHYNATHAPTGSPYGSPRVMSFYDGRASALRERRRILGLMYLQLRKAMP